MTECLGDGDDEEEVDEEDELDVEPEDVDPEEAAAKLLTTFFIVSCIRSAFSLVKYCGA